MKDAGGGASEEITERALGRRDGSNNGGEGGDRSTRHRGGLVDREYRLILTRSCI
jgi:hypothetical protein